MRPYTTTTPCLQILHMNSDYEPLGRHWVPNFITRNPRIASVVGRTIESARTTGANYETIRSFLQLFERTRIELGIQYKDIWNMDETGVALGVCTNHQVLASSSKKKAYTKSPEDREWVSIIEACSATGIKLQCLVISKGKHLESTWFPAAGVPDWLYTTSENGWTSNSIGSERLQRILYQVLHHHTLAIDCSSWMAMAPTRQLTLCSFASFIRHTFSTSLLTPHTCSSLLILLLSQSSNHAIETRSELSQRLMTQPLLRKSALLHHIIRQEKKDYQRE